MQVNIRHPRVIRIDTLKNGAGHYIDLQELCNRLATVTIYVNQDWEAWDAIVEAVAIYRETHSDLSGI